MLAGCVYSVHSVSSLIGCKKKVHKTWFYLNGGIDDPVEKN